MSFRGAADTSIAIGLLGAAGAAVTGITDWSDVDPPARRLGLIHGLLNVGVTALFITSLIVRKRSCAPVVGSPLPTVIVSSSRWKDGVRAESRR